MSSRKYHPPDYLAIVIRRVQCCLIVVAKPTATEEAQQRIQAAHDYRIQLQYSVSLAHEVQIKSGTIVRQLLWRSSRTS